ncbi:protein FAM83D [Leuresthes tenuis]|uniref:protein FAM83D n=1 Tax=Leuresthes tenuis TaxID=355514 RepID=UPI003B500DC1
MSNSQEQSLNENVVFLPVDKSSPEFLYCEEEREAVERLLSEGPEAFYSSIGSKCSGCFLSPEEVSQITSWAQSYHLNPPQVEEENGVENSSEMEDFCSTYFPDHTDMPPPDLELGWPIKPFSVLEASVAVHTNPPAEGEPPVREVIRRHLQKARKVIAIVTNRLTDSAIIGDLHNAASRNVPVYILLNQRSIQENFTLNRLRHPNMRVRVLRGKTFCSRSGRMVVGELKDNYLLVDLQTVIHGSYSLTWTDAHLHRQLITVLTGPAVDLFDREFRILFAASVPAPEPLRVTAGTHANLPHQLKDFSHLRSHKQLCVETENTNPPSPPADSVLDWEAMGVGQGDRCLPGSPLELHEDVMADEIPQHKNDSDRPIMDSFAYKEHQFMDKRRLWENFAPVTAAVTDQSRILYNAEHLSRDPPTTERVKRLEHTIARKLFIEKDTDLYDRTTAGLNDKAPDPMQYYNKRWQPSSLMQNLEKERATVEDCSKVENAPTSRRPIILRVPQSDSFSSVSDIMKRIPGTSNLLRRGVNSTVSDRTQSMMNLSGQSLDVDHNGRGVPVPRFQASYEPDHTTLALALIKKRNDEVKSSLFRTSKTFEPKERTRSSDWSGLLTKRKGAYD